MALTNEELQQILDNLTPEERKQLQSQLDRQIKIDNITNPTQSTNTKPKVKPKQDNKDLSSNDLTNVLFKMVTGYVDNTDRANMTRTTIKDLVTRELPIDTKGFY